MNKITFKDDRVKKYFMKLCEESPHISVDWDKFREKDMKGIFKEFTNVQLSLRFRKYRLMKDGICIYCGKRKANGKYGFCIECETNYRRIASRSKRNKEMKEAA